MAEAASRRLALREEQAAHAETWAALREANRALLRLALAGRLAFPRDLELYVSIEDLTDASGRLVWPRVTAVVDELLTQRPNLAAPAASPECPGCGLRSNPAGLIEAQASGTAETAQGATRCEPGAGADGITHPTESR